MLFEIQLSGMTQSAIGAAIGRSQVWVCDALSGRYKDIKSTDMKSLIALHSERCGTTKSV